MLAAVAQHTPTIYFVVILTNDYNVLSIDPTYTHPSPQENKIHFRLSNCKENLMQQEQIIQLCKNCL